MDSYFDVPAGYNDADLEMRALEDAGNRAARRYRGLTLEQRDDLAAGFTTTTGRISKDDGTHYKIHVRATDADELGPCGFEYSMTGAAPWYPTSKAARLAEAN